MNWNVVRDTLRKEIIALDERLKSAMDNNNRDGVVVLLTAVNVLVAIEHAVTRGIETKPRLV